MEGSGSNNKRGSDNLPPVVPRRNRRRVVEEENLNPADGEESIENATTEAQLNLEHQPQPEHQPHPEPELVVGGGGDMQQAAIDQSRLANRRYSEAYRNRRQDHLQHLQNLKENLEAEVAQNIPLLQNSMVEGSMLNEQNVTLKQQFEVAFENLVSKEAETEKLRTEIEAEKKLKEARDQHIMNNMVTNPEFHVLQEALNNALSMTLRPFFPLEGMNPPAGDEDGDSEAGGRKPPNPDEAGPSGAKDDDPTDM